MLLPFHAQNREEKAEEWRLFVYDKNMNTTETLLHRQSLLSEGMNATFEVPLRFTKAFIGEFVDPTGEKKIGKIIEGIASTEDKDQQGEIVMQDRMDCSYLLDKGYLNWNHSHAPEDQIGKPLEVIKMPGGPNTPGGKPATFFKASLFEGMPRADAVWVLSKALENSQGIGADRALGFSVEGGVRVRQGHVLVETVVRHMAVTHEPVNAQSTARVVLAKSQGFKVDGNVMIDTLDNNVPHFIFKSFSQLVNTIAVPMVGGKKEKRKVEKTIGIGDSGALLLENLSTNKDKRISPKNLLRGLYSVCKSDRHCHNGETFAKGRQGALDHLMNCVGLSPEQAADSLAMIITSLR